MNYIPLANQSGWNSMQVWIKSRCISLGSECRENTVTVPPITTTEPKLNSRWGYWNFMVNLLYQWNYQSLLPSYRSFWYPLSHKKFKTYEKTIFKLQVVQSTCTTRHRKISSTMANSSRFKVHVVFSTIVAGKVLDDPFGIVPIKGEYIVM